MSVIVEQPPGDPLIFDAIRDNAWVEHAKLDREGRLRWWQLETAGDEAVRLLSPAVIGGDMTVRVDCRIRTGPVPPREIVVVAILAGVVLTLDDTGLHWYWQTLGGATQDRLHGFQWEPERWYEMSVVGKMSRDAIGSLALAVDGDVYGAVVAAQTWSLDMPRSWVAGITNIRPEVASGVFTVECSALTIRQVVR